MLICAAEGARLERIAVVSRVHVLACHRDVHASFLLQALSLLQWSYFVPRFVYLVEEFTVFFCARNIDLFGECAGGELEQAYKICYLF